MNSFVLYTFSNIISYSLIMIFLKSSNIKNKGDNFSYLFLYLPILINILGNTLLNSGLPFLLLKLVCIIVFLYGFDLKLEMKLFFTFFFMVIGAIPELTIAYISKSLSIGDPSYIEMFLLSHLFKILIFIGIIKIKNKNFLFDHKSISTLIITLIPLVITSAMMIVGIINNNLSNITFIFFILSVSVFTLLIILGSRLNHNLAIKELEISHLKSMIDTKNAYYKDLLAYEKKISKLKHDFKNQVTGIIASGDKLEDNLMELAQELNLSDIRYSNVPLINAILNSKLKDLEIPKENKTISIDIKNMINIDPGDFGILLGNSLDNCVEALNFLEPENRFLKLDIHDLANMVLISIENTYDPSQEKEGENRGFGLRSINEIINKYEGRMKIDKGEVFSLEMSFINNKS